MDTTKYDPLRLQVLYLVFRHKLAHLSFSALCLRYGWQKGISAPQTKAHNVVCVLVQATHSNRVARSLYYISTKDAETVADGLRL